jgi:hypothetical protein
MLAEATSTAALAGRSHASSPTPPTGKTDSGGSAVNGAGNNNHNADDAGLSAPPARTIDEMFRLRPLCGSSAAAMQMRFGGHGDVRRVSAPAENGHHCPFCGVGGVAPSAALISYRTLLTTLGATPPLSVVNARAILDPARRRVTAILAAETARGERVAAASRRSRAVDTSTHEQRVTSDVSLATDTLLSALNDGPNYTLPNGSVVRLPPFRPRLFAKMNDKTDDPVSQLLRMPPGAGGALPPFDVDAAWLVDGPTAAANKGTRGAHHAHVTEGSRGPAGVRALNIISTSSRLAARLRRAGFPSVDAVAGGGTMVDLSSHGDAQRTSAQNQHLLASLSLPRSTSLSRSSLHRPTPTRVGSKNPTASRDGDQDQSAAAASAPTARPSSGPWVNQGVDAFTAYHRKVDTCDATYGPNGKGRVPYFVRFLHPAMTNALFHVYGTTEPFLQCRVRLCDECATEATRGFLLTRAGYLGPLDDYNNDPHQNTDEHRHRGASASPSLPRSLVMGDASRLVNSASAEETDESTIEDLLESTGIGSPMRRHDLHLRPVVGSIRAASFAPATAAAAATTVSKLRRSPSPPRSHGPQQSRPASPLRSPGSTQRSTIAAGSDPQSLAASLDGAAEPLSPSGVRPLSGMEAAASSRPQSRQQLRLQASSVSQQLVGGASIPISSNRRTKSVAAVIAMRSLLGGGGTPSAAAAVRSQSIAVCSQYRPSRGCSALLLPTSAGRGAAASPLGMEQAPPRRPALNAAGKTQFGAAAGASRPRTAI